MNIQIELSVVEIEHKQILTAALNMMDRVFYGNKSDRKMREALDSYIGIKVKIE